jgi:hypothetical protein
VSAAVVEFAVHFELTSLPLTISAATTNPVGGGGREHRPCIRHLGVFKREAERTCKAP